jgi:MFS family permease
MVGMEVQELEETHIAAPPLSAAVAHEQRMNASLIAGIVVGFLLRCAGAASGVMLGFYINRVIYNGAAPPDLFTGLTAAFFAVELLLAPVFGGWSDRIGRKPFLLAGPIIAGLAVQIHPLTTLIWVIAIGRLLEGLATSTTTPATLGFLGDMTSGSAALRGRVMGLYELGSLVGIVVGPAVGGQLWDWFQRDGLRLISLIDVAAALLVILLIKESRPQVVAVPAEGAPAETLRTRLAAYGALLRLPRLWQFALAWIAVNGVVGLWLNQITPLLSRAHRHPTQLLQGGWSGEQVGQIFLGFGVVFAIGIFFWSQLYGRLRKTNVMLLAIAGAVVACVALFGINMQVLPGPWGQWPLVAVLVFGLFLESAFTPVALAYLADITEGRVQNRGTVMGLYSVFLGVGQILGTALGGRFIDALGFNGLLICTLLLIALAAAAVLNLRFTTGD